MEHAERSGFVLEGRKRRAYYRHGAWVDGVIYGLTVEDLEEPTTLPAASEGDR
jgi:RimJ/RimL family protein N-acetyltransferase